MWWRPWFTSSISCSRSRGAVATSTSPDTATTAQPSCSDTSIPRSTTHDPPEPDNATRKPTGSGARWLRRGCDHPMDVVTPVGTTLMGPMALTETALDTLLGALDDVGDPGIVHIERLAARPARTARAGPPPRPRAARGARRGRALEPPGAGRSTSPARAGRWRSPRAPRRASRSATRRPSPRRCSTGCGRARRCASIPTKALAQDQLRSFTDARAAAARRPAPTTATAAPEARPHARKHASVLLTNPEMLHCGLLPHHQRWATFLMRLRYVVIDELHTMRGIFGSHVAHVLRRLRRLCARYGSSPTFIFTSATIGEPARLASALCGLPVEEVSDDGSPRGERVVVLWNPPLLDAATGARASSRRTTARMVASLVARDHRCIAFSRSRRTTETVAAEARRLLPRDLAPLVRPYRGGYLAAERREIEGELADGRLKGVVATNALELGVDIGGLDACVLDGFPGTIASFWQQAGRAGREQQRSLAVLVAGDDALDQYLAVHPARAVHPAARAGGGQPVQPLRARRPPRLRRVRVAAHPRRRAVVGPRRPRRRRAPAGHARPPRGAPGAAGPAPPAAEGGVGGPRVPVPRRRPAHRVQPRAPHRAGRRHPGRHGRRHPGPGGRAPRRDVPAPGPLLPGRVARPRRRRGGGRARVGRRVHPGAHVHARSRCSTTSCAAPSAGPTCTSAPSRSPRRSPATSAATSPPARRSAWCRSTCRRPGSSPGRSGT